MGRRYLNRFDHHRYAGIVSTTSTACWPTDQLNLLATYQTTNNIKMVILYTFPTPQSGVGFGPAFNMSAPSVLSFASTYPAAYRKGYPANMRLPISNVFRYILKPSSSSYDLQCLLIVSLVTLVLLQTVLWPLQLCISTLDAITQLWQLSLSYLMDARV